MTLAQQNFFMGSSQLGLTSGTLQYFTQSTSRERTVQDAGAALVTETALQPASMRSQAALSATCQLPEGRGCLLCITSMPAHMVPTDMLQLFAPFRQSMSYVRILRPCRGSDSERLEYMVVLQMLNQELADSFYRQYNGQPFSSMEEACCEVVFVASISFIDAQDGSCDSISALGALPNACATAAAAAAGPADTSQALHSGGAEAREDACVICFEKLEGGTLTTACNHTFHIECIALWQDSPCPVCRFHHNGSGDDSTCQECGRSVNVHVCLICGYVGCGGREQGGHMSQHHLATLHAYALDVETQQVWDFAGGGFVHRLIYNKADGKMVEANNPGHASGERPQAPSQLSDVQEERLVHGKLEGLAWQYNTLLASQMDQQRAFYEKQIGRLLEEQEEERSRRGRATGQEVATALRHEQRQLQQKVLSLEERLRKARDDIEFQKELRASLEANENQWEAQLRIAAAELEAAVQAKLEWVPQLEDKVAELMQKLDTSGGAAEAKGIAAEVPVAAAQLRKVSPEKGTAAKGRKGSKT
eukprot:TRINITY_DN1536_c0_g1_i3.p1 TRINITY_DN1536_c0_g1~~TRINITY_DN1536_c0_g1_i3.p1  ORF type:complete len:534 (+),score=148.69 TRINITY_DN1536_c0_g1_i3:57-1658(+)